MFVTCFYQHVVVCLQWPHLFSDWVGVACFQRAAACVERGCCQDSSLKWRGSLQNGRSLELGVACIIAVCLELGVACIIALGRP